MIPRLDLAIPEDREALEGALRSFGRERRAINRNHEKAPLLAAEDQAVAAVAGNVLDVCGPDGVELAFAMGTVFALITIAGPSNQHFEERELALTIADVARQVARIPLADPADLHRPAPVIDRGPAVSRHGDVEPGAMSDPVPDDQHAPGEGSGEDCPPRP